MGLFSWFKKRSAPQGTIPEGGGMSIFMPLSVGGTDTRSTRAEQLAAYAGWVYAATTLIADDAAKVPYRVILETQRTVRETPRAPLTQLMRNFVGMTTMEAKTLTYLHLLLTGNAFWLVITAGGKEGGRPIGLQVLNPDWLQVDTTRAGVTVQTWRLSVPGFQTRVVSGEDVVHFRLMSPFGGAWGYSPVRAFALSYDSDLYARAYSADLLKNQARPDGILSSDQTLTPDQADLLKTRWKQNVTRGDIAVLGAGTRYQPIASTLKDLEFLNLAQLNREAILGIYRVPASKLGLDTSRSQAYAAENNKTYEENAVKPHVVRFDDRVNASLAPRVGMERLQHDNPVQENRKEKLEETERLWKVGLLTANEARAYTGWEVLEGAEGNMRLIPASYRVVDKLEPTEPETEATETIITEKESA